MAILNRFGLVSSEHLTNAGEVLFGGTKPVSLKAGIFATDEKLTILDMKLFEDNILQSYYCCRRIHPEKYEMES